jgi:hypothetical protein
MLAADAQINCIGKDGMDAATISSAQCNSNNSF